ncbi:MAG: methylmalonyl Co-A mutase-associated GTPase MeaB [Candidatus Latescibacteria bacterium]|jgi:LAO/AO transport system kinase|nr:methylmalonyl Co-A mutase-associated GTPase MeaB [Candidatus Latescibacterota bacterium]
MTQTLEQLVQHMVSSDPSSEAVRVRAAARLMSVLEDDPGRLADFSRAVAAAGQDHAPRAGADEARLVLGVTGPPGSGKSTLTDALIAEYRTRHPSRRVGAIAVDPSSPFTHGAVLGDRIRMMRHATDPMVFIRSLASRGHLGGLSRGVAGVRRVMELIGCDPVLIETVGVGQNEIEVTRIADLVMVVLAPGQGDGVQMLKAGLLEIGDMFVVNKADQPAAGELRRQLAAALELRGGPGSKPGPVHTCLVSALSGDGVAGLTDALERITEEQHRSWRENRPDGL